MKAQFVQRLVRRVGAPIAGLAIILLWSFIPAPSTVYSDTDTFRDTTSSVIENNTLRRPVFSFHNSMEIFDSLRLENAGLSRLVFRTALKGMEKLWNTGRLKEHVISIIDFSQPSSNKRLYVIDLDNFELLYNTWVAHGQKSGKSMAQVFSNKPGSYKSSLGFYITGEAYQGSNGYSLKLQGVEKGINDFAYRRAVVLHGANYVSENWIASQGYLGRSQGCPAVPVEVCQPIIDHIKEGTCLFIYHPTSTYRAKSKLAR